MMTAERRRLPRRSPAADEPLARVRLRAGRHLAVVNVSNAGMLVEGDTRLLPGTHVDVHVITTEGRQLVRGRILRACVSQVAADLIRYCGALSFERLVDTVAIGYDLPDALAGPRAAEGSGYPGQPSRVALADCSSTPIVRSSPL